MSDSAIAILDGTSLRSLHVSLPDSDSDYAGARVLDFAESTASNSLSGLPLPHHLKSCALKRANISDDATFRQSQLTKDAAATTLHEYLTAIADQLKEKPLVVSVLDGKTLRLFLEDEDDFAMIAENLFTELDTEDRGKIAKSEIRNAVLNMGIEMGVPSFEDFPSFNDILKKHGAEGGEELGVSQFAELLQSILQEVADALVVKPIFVIHDIQIFNGFELRKLLADEKQLESVIERILQEKHGAKDDQKSTEIIRSFIEKSGKQFGLPSFEANEAVQLLYDSVFADVESGNSAAGVDQDEFKGLVRKILEKFVEQLEANPVFCDPED